MTVTTMNPFDDLVAPAAEVVPVEEETLSNPLDNGIKNDNYHGPATLYNGEVTAHQAKTMLEVPRRQHPLAPPELIE